MLGRELASTWLVKC